MNEETTYYLHDCIFHYNVSGIRLNNWLDGEIDNQKVLMYWWDGVPFLTGMEKNVTIKSAVHLINPTFDFKVDGKIIGQGIIKSFKCITQSPITL